MKIEEYYDSREEYSLEHFIQKTTTYRANQAISKSFDWVDLQGKKVLDIGCGVGYYAIPLALKCNHITGIDISNHNIELANKYSREMHIRNTTFTVSDLLEYSTSEKFDFIFAITVLMHCQNIDLALQKIQSLLKPGGYFLVSDLNKWFPPRLLHRKNDLPIFAQTFTLPGLVQKLQGNGFAISKVSGRIYSLGGLRKPDWVVALWLEKFAHLFPVKFLGEHVAILATRSIK